MDWLGVATASAAVLAAVLSGLSLYFSGRRALDQWTRETLVDTVTAFLGASFQLSGVCRRVLEGPLDVPERRRLCEQLLSIHSEESKALTQLRLVGTSGVVSAARLLFDKEFMLAEPCFADPIPFGSYEELNQPVNAQRAVFIQEARKALGLRARRGTGTFDRSYTWSGLRSALESGMAADATADPQ